MSPVAENSRVRKRKWKNKCIILASLIFFAGSWFFEFGILAAAPAGYPTQSNSVTAREAPLYAVLSDWTPAADFAGQVARLLNVKETMRTTSHSQAGLTERAGDDDFWSVIGITAAWDQIIK